jgi:2-methylisocitrate lyase-like PEP mutase family enzyme
VRAAADAARGLGRDFVLVARADGLLTGSYGLREAIARMKSFEQAGADCVYAPMLPDLAAVVSVCAGVRAPVNVLAAGPLAGASRAELAKAGVARISVGSGLARLAQASLIGAVREIVEKGDFRTLVSAARAAEIDALLEAGRGAAEDAD